METLYNGFTLEICEGGFPLSTDSMALSHFARLKKNARVLDLGSGCGTLGLLLCAKDPGCTVTGIELSEAAHLGALENIRRNGLEGRLASICGDLRRLDEIIPAGSFSTCISNPPYFSGGPESRRGSARREDCCSLEELFHAAARALAWGGDFYLVHRPERLAELCAEAANHGFAAKRLALLRHREGGPLSLILLACRKGAKNGLTFEELCLQDAQGQPTDTYRQIYHL